MKRLPDSEFEIMKAVWSVDPPVTANQVIAQLENEKNWKAPSVISFLLRLVDKGFLRTEKHGKERLYYPMVDQEHYLHFETTDFVKRYHGNSLASLMSALTKDDKLKDEDLDALIDWARKMR